MITPADEHEPASCTRLALPRRTRRETADFVIESIKALDIEPHPESRLMKMHRVLMSGFIPNDSPDFETALEAERDFKVLALVFDLEHGASPDPEFEKRVKTVIKDSVLPEDNMQQSKGRDIQFELFVAALCKGGGMVPVIFEEPDVTCTVGDQKIGIAAKRIKSYDCLKDCVKKAASQIQRSGLPGIIALDTCLGLNPMNDRIGTPIPDEEFGGLYSDAMTDFLMHHAKQLRHWIQGKGVLGIVFHDQQVRQRVVGDWELAGFSMLFDTSTTLRKKRQLDRFWNRYRSGLPNVEHLDAHRN